MTLDAFKAWSNDLKNAESRKARIKQAAPWLIVAVVVIVVVIYIRKK